MIREGRFVRTGVIAALVTYPAWFILVSILQQSQGTQVALLPYWAAAFVFVAILWAWWDRARLTKWECTLLLFAVLGSRLPLLVVDPYFSDDVFRYVWEGRVVAAGENPYAFAPNAAELEPLRDGSIWPRVGHPEVSAVYPPFAQELFALVALLGGGVLMMKCLLLAFDLLTTWLLWRWTIQAGCPQGRIVLWALHPLVIVCIAGSGHLEAILCAGLAWMLWGAMTARPLHVAVGLTMAAMTKGVALLFVPHVWRHLPSRHRLLLLTVPVLFLFSYLPFIEQTGGVFRAFANFANRWEANGSVYTIIVQVMMLADPGASAFRFVLDAAGSVIGVEALSSRVIQPYPELPAADPARLLSRWICLVLWLVVWGLAMCRRELSIEQRWLIVMVAGLLLSPVVHPWYLLLLIPPMMRAPHPALIWWTLSVAASWWALDAWKEDGVWRESLAAWLLQYGGMVLIIGVTMFAGRQRSHVGNRSEESPSLN